MDYLKRSLIPFGMYTIMQFYNMVCPSMFTNWVFRQSGNKHTLLFTNVAAYVKPVHYAGGGLSRRFFFLGSGSGNIATTLSLVSVLKRLQLCVTSDETQIEDVPQFVQLFNDEITALGLEYDPEEEGYD